MTNQASSLDLDVVGLNWAPLNGTVVADFFPRFEILLGTSERMPEEGVSGATPPSLLAPDSGLDPSLAFTASSIAADPMTVVHPRNRGYTVRVIDRFNSNSAVQTSMMITAQP